MLHGSGIHHAHTWCVRASASRHAHTWLPVASRVYIRVSKYMCIRVRVCACVYVCARACIHMYICIHIYTHSMHDSASRHAHTWIPVTSQVYICVPQYLYMCNCVCVSIVYTRLATGTHVCVCITCVYVNTYTV